ncbi:MAG: ATP synthase F1 subunit delta [Gammaproteobacteria bacterium RIFCSPHIGHO2_12_FULL_40_19]|nr:MAG: ATP synthase F1 subunit delta [Gammaproteobacteria bacterium RIFCSPHIGHO2_12_FULL_40_19]
MTNTLTIARPYAKAAFSAAKSANQLPLWSSALKQLSMAVNDSQMKSALLNPAFTEKLLGELLISFLHKASGNGSENGFAPIENFIHTLAEKKRLALFPALSELFEESLAKEAGYLSLVVTSAFSMDENQKIQTKEKLSKQLKSDLVIDYRVDASLIGGLLVRSGNWVMDGTIKGALDRLRSALI